MADTAFAAAHRGTPVTPVLTPDEKVEGVKFGMSTPSSCNWKCADLIPSPSSGVQKLEPTDIPSDLNDPDNYVCSLA